MPIETDRVKQAIEDIKQGKMIVMVDDEDRENEGDLVYGANFSTTEKVNFAISKAKGVLCVALNKEIADKLDLNLMVEKNSSCHETAFTVSVDARDASTGVSAYERDMTIKLLADCNTKPYDLVRPGHIFPLIAKKGGVLERTGHTEGSVDLCKLAGIAEAAVICEIVKEDGMMARRADLDEFCKLYNLSMVYVSDIVQYRTQNETLIQKIDENEVDFLGTKVRKVSFQDHKDDIHIAYVFGKEKKRSAVKIHRIIPDVELFANKGKFDLLMRSIEHFKKEGGILIFLDSKSKEETLARSIGIGAQITKFLGVDEIELLSSDITKEFVGIGGFGLNIVKNL